MIFTANVCVTVIILAFVLYLSPTAELQQGKPNLHSCFSPTSAVLYAFTRLP